MKTAIELWQYVSCKGLKPLPKTSVSEWADNYRIISQGNAEPGRWRTSRTKYQREIMDSFTQGGIHRVVVKSTAQIGKSDVLPSEMIQRNHLCNRIFAAVRFNVIISDHFRFLAKKTLVSQAFVLLLQIFHLFL